MGRVTAEDIQDPNSDEILVYRNQIIDEEIADKIVSAGVQKVKIRSVMACAEKHGACTKGGRDSARGRLVNVGEAVGVIAAQSIGEPEPNSQCVPSTLVVPLKVEVRSSQEVNNSGVVHFSADLKDALVEDRNGQMLTTNRNGEVKIIG